MNKQAKKGRSKDLIKLRDESLVRRFFELTEIKRLRFDDTLTKLSQEEYFICEPRILLIIRQNQELIKNLYEQRLTKNKTP